MDLFFLYISVQSSKQCRPLKARIILSAAEILTVWCPVAEYALGNFYIYVMCDKDGLLSL